MNSITKQLRREFRDSALSQGVYVMKPLQHLFDYPGRISLLYTLDNKKEKTERKGKLPPTLPKHQMPLQLKTLECSLHLGPRGAMQPSTQLTLDCFHMDPPNLPLYMPAMQYGDYEVVETATGEGNTKKQLHLPPDILPHNKPVLNSSLAPVQLTPAIHTIKTKHGHTNNKGTMVKAFKTPSPRGPLDTARPLTSPLLRTGTRRVPRGLGGMPWRAVTSMFWANRTVTRSMFSPQVPIETWNNSFLRQYLQNVHFSLLSDTIYFDEVGSRPGYYDIVNWIFPDGHTVIGNFNASAPEKDQLFINTTAFQWNQKFRKIPRSTCSDTCQPGYRKSTRQGEPSCCYDCVPCSEGEITNATDMETCISCPEDQWSNQGRDTCIPRTVEFLSYEDPMGAALAAVAVVLVVITALVLGLFILNWDSPVVRANNRGLSFLLLIALMLSFFCSLLFIGYPGKITCKLRQTVFGLFFTVAASSVLAKTITVVIAFKATKPNSKLRKILRTSISYCFVLVCTLGQAAICTVWLITSPPYPDYDTQSITGKMILKCNEGSPIAFYIVVSYLGVLAALSFVVAFAVRKVPDRYNEAQMITFSMLMFCSVWITFVPAYLSSNSKYMVALEIFAILTSSSGILGCIFFPKCYIIMLRPEQNVCLLKPRPHCNIGVQYY
ncbi:vomeronasal type-2 receptor 26-like [Bombina bombina]|uniref:vomeronasal type-2 receptor 26-like n=1 Tax=Bombina bombina TaxID=8345 RepID=UPI00235A51B6|nr:vomeronasal type-2 receptor 26-like [Bombina bombina]